MYIPAELKQKEIKFSQWESRKILVTKRDKQNKLITQEKSVSSLYPHTESLESSVKKLKGLVRNLKFPHSNISQAMECHDILRTKQCIGHEWGGCGRGIRIKCKPDCLS